MQVPTIDRLVARAMSKRGLFDTAANFRRAEEETRRALENAGVAVLLERLRVAEQERDGIDGLMTQRNLLHSECIALREYRGAYRQALLTIAQMSDEPYARSVANGALGKEPAHAD